MERIDRSEDMAKVLDFIKTQKNPVGKKAILEATGYDGDFAYCINTLMHQHDEIKTTGTGRSRTYSWNPAKALYSEMKNSEGYSDSTAGKAIANVMKSDGKYHLGVKFGEVWSYALSPNASYSTVKRTAEANLEGMLITSSKAGTCIGYKVYSVKESFMKDGFTFSWEDSKGWPHYISLLHVVNTQDWKLGKKICTLKASDKNDLKTKVAAIMDISIIEKEVPVVETKEVEKIVEVEKPVEVLVEKEVPVEVVKPVEIHAEEREIVMAVLKTKVEIYEKLIFGGANAIMVSQEKQAI